MTATTEIPTEELTQKVQQVVAVATHEAEEEVRDFARVRRQRLAQEVSRTKHRAFLAWFRWLMPSKSLQRRPSLAAKR